MVCSLVSVQDNDYIQVIPVYLTYSGCFDTHTEGSCLVLVSVQDNDYIQVISVYLTYSGCFDTHTEGSCLVLLFQYKIMTISRLYLYI